MPRYIVRIIRKRWTATDYVGLYVADTAEQAIAKAQSDSYCRRLLKMRPKSIVRIEAELTVDGEFPK